MIRLSWCALLVLLLGSHASAKKPDYGKARKAFSAGLAALKANKLVEAVQRFEEAYKISGDATVMGYVALAHERSARYLKAAEALMIYRTAVPKDEKQEIDWLIKRFKKAHANVVGSKVIEEVERPQESPRRRFWTWIAAGGTLLAAATGTALAVSAQSSYDSLEATCSPLCPSGEADSIKGRAIAADVFFGLALGGAVGTAVLYYLEGRGATAKEKEDAPEAAAVERLGLQVGPGSVGLRLAF